MIYLYVDIDLGTRGCVTRSSRQSCKLFPHNVCAVIPDSQRSGSSSGRIFAISGMHLEFRCLHDNIWLDRPRSSSLQEVTTYRAKWYCIFRRSRWAMLLGRVVKDFAAPLSLTLDDHWQSWTIWRFTWTTKLATSHCMSPQPGPWHLSNGRQ